MMKRLAIILLAALALSACMRSVDGYNSDPHVVSLLSAYSGKKISVAEFDASPGEGIISQCRGYSIITTPGENSLVRYIQDAFISELELADAYSPDSSIVLTGKITQVSLSTLTGGEWIIKMTVSSNNGRAISVREQLLFKTNIVGQSACQVASDTFSIAVQNLLRRLVSSPGFRTLLEPSRYPKKQDPVAQKAERPSEAPTLSAGPVSLESSIYSGPDTVEIVPMDITTMSQPVPVDEQPAQITVQPQKAISTSDCSVEKQIQRQQNRSSP